MHSRSLTVLLGLLTLMTILRPTTVDAQQVTEYAVGRYVSYTQTSTASPVDPELWTLLGYIVTDVPGSILSAELSFNVPPPVSYPMTVANAFIRQYLGEYFTSEAAFLLAFPETTYTMTADLGAGPVTGNLILAADLYCPQIPAFTGDTFARMQAYDTRLAFSGTVNGFTLAPGTDSGSSTITLIQVGQPGALWTANLQPGDTEFNIPAALLLPGTLYNIGISYFNVASTPNGGFTAATSGAEFYRGTTATFTTLAHEIEYYQISKVSRFTQTSVFPPVNADSWQMIGWLRHTPDEVASATISFHAPAAITVAMLEVNTRLHYYPSVLFASRSALDLSYPPATYTFSADRVGTGPQTADVFLPAGLYPVGIPAMTGDTYNRLQSYDAAQPFLLSINGFAPPLGANENHTTVQIVGGGVVFVINVASSDTLITIPANTLLPATSHQILIEYSSSIETLMAGFGTARSYATFLRDTTATFTTEPACLADVNHDGIVDGSDFIAFINSFGSGDVAIDPLADVAGAGASGLLPDGIIDGSDFIAFINAFGAGC